MRREREDGAQHATGGRTDRELLRFLTCGSVDDGKSTLIGRLLFETGNIPSDELATLARDNVRRTDDEREGPALDYALLVDGLEAEREQGITIDVAYRFFSTPRRKFVVADTPGHRQYTRNMATGASRADLALLLVDARHGILEQTRRHAFIVRLMGIRQVILAVNKMDLVGYREEAFRRIAEEFRSIAGGHEHASVTAVPIAAAYGENLAHRSLLMPWYDGPTILDALEAARPGEARPDAPLRFPVQWVNRPSESFRGYCGTLAAGRVQIGDTITLARTGDAARVASIFVADRSAEAAIAGDAVTLTLDEKIDLSRGDMLVAPTARPHVADQFAAHLLWMNEAPLLPGRNYLIRAGTFTGTATVTELKHVVDVESGAETAGKTLDMNAVGFVNISTGAAFAFDPFDDCPGTGGFILIDRFTNETVAAGMIRFPLRRADNIHWQALAVSKATRGRLKLQKPAMLWFTGLSGAGKSTIADLVERRLVAADRHTYLLDGDNVRHGLNRDLGFTDADRVENIRRVAEVGRLFVDAGLITLVSFISPFRAERLIARELLEEGEFVEIFVDAPLQTCEARDPKGLYARARAGGLSNFTGIDSPYEPPLDPDIHLRTDRSDPSALADEVMAFLRARGIA